MVQPIKTSLFIAVKPVGSKFAKALQGGLKELGYKVLRCSPSKGVDHQNKGRKVFFVTQQTKDKIEQFRAFEQSNVSAPKYALQPSVIRESDVGTWFARTLINSTNGRGIVEFNKEDEQYPNAPLYTAYIPKKSEFRVHVFNGKVIDVQRKAKRKDFNEDERNTRIRNVANGYVYVREGVSVPDETKTLAINAVNAVGYTYGAVDIIYNEHRNAYYVLEVNSRPGLMGTTLTNYVNALKELI